MSVYDYFFDRSWVGVDTQVVRNFLDGYTTVLIVIFLKRFDKLSSYHYQATIDQCYYTYDVTRIFLRESFYSWVDRDLYYNHWNSEKKLLALAGLEPGTPSIAGRRKVSITLLDLRTCVTKCYKYRVVTFITFWCSLIMRNVLLVETFHYYKITGLQSH